MISESGPSKILKLPHLPLPDHYTTKLLKGDEAQQVIKCGF